MTAQPTIYDLRVHFTMANHFMVGKVPTRQTSNNVFHITSNGYQNFTPIRLRQGRTIAFTAVAVRPRKGLSNTANPKKSGDIHMLKKLVVCGAATTGAAAIVLGTGLAQANDGPAPTSKTAGRSKPFHTARMAGESLVSRAPRPLSARGSQIAQPHRLRNALTSRPEDQGRSGRWWRYMMNGDHDKKQTNDTFNVINLCGVDVLGLDHLVSPNHERPGKCAQSSFNRN